MKDGVIKFKIARWKKNDSIEKGLWEELEEARKQLYKLNLIGYDESSGFGFGNMSKRIRKNRFIITGSQTGRLNALDEKHFSIITRVRINKNSLECLGPIPPSSESITHAIFYIYNKKINSVIHIHSNDLWNYMVSNEMTSTSDYAEYGSAELSVEIKKIIKKNISLIPIPIAIKGHESGIFIGGNDLRELTDYIIKFYDSIRLKSKSSMKFLNH